MIVVYVALVLVDALLVLALIALRKRWEIVAAGIVLATAFNLWLLGSVPHPAGWPTTRPIPNGSHFLACYVDEPTYIYFWIDEGAPRSYRVDYSRELHVTCVTAQKASQQGVQVGLRRQGRAHRHGQQYHPGRYVPYVLPPSLPAKTGSN